MGEGRRLGGLPITAIATCTLAFALAVCTAPLLASAAFLAQAAACALGMLLDIAGNLSDANLVATENAEQYACCLDWLHTHLGRIALEVGGLSIGIFAVLDSAKAPTTGTAKRPFAQLGACPRTRLLARASMLALCDNGRIKP